MSGNGHQRQRWIGLVRVSSDDQDGGRDTQEDTIRRWVEARGDTLACMFVDDGVPGTMEYLPKRDAISAAWEAMAAGVADGIVVTRLDRLARDVELQELLLRECRNRRAVVASCNAEEERLLEGLAEPDPSRKLIRVILGAVAEYERGVIRVRTRAGIARAIREGRWMGGRLPYGQRVDPSTGKLVLDEREAAIIGQSMTLRALGCTLTEIGEFWVQAGMKPRTSTARRFADWSVSVVLDSTRDKGIEPVPLSALGMQFAGAREAILGLKLGMKTRREQRLADQEA